MPEFNSLDEEIKMSVVKFKENEQKKMKGFTRVLYIVSKIAKAFSIIAVCISVLLVIGDAIVVPNTNINTSNKTIKVFNDSVKYELTNSKLLIDDEEIILLDKYESNEVNKVLNMSKTKKLILSEMLMITLTSVCYISYLIFSYLTKLFKNIHDNDTPFSMENVNSIRKLALCSLLFVLVPDVIGTIAEIVFNLNLYVEINIFAYLFSLMLLVLAYIFKYGYEIQLDSKGIMYDEK